MEGDDDDGAMMMMRRRGDERMFVKRSEMYESSELGCCIHRKSNDEI